MTAMENTVNIKKMVGERLKDARKARGLTHKALCDRVNWEIRCDPSYNPSSPYPPELVVNTYRAWESGINQINMAYIPVLKSVLDLDVGYLFGEYPEFHKEAADICAATGLSETAVESLKSHAERTAYYHIKGKKPQEILSAFLTDSEFWQILNSLFQYSNPDTLSLIDSLLSTSSAYALPSNAPYSEDVLIMDTGRETMIAGVSRHFGNVAERAIGWDKKNQ